jgi:hypothetical protein
MCCRDAQEEARTRMTLAETAMRDHGLYRIEGDEEATVKWVKAKEHFHRARADHERLCGVCCQ